MPGVLVAYFSPEFPGTYDSILVFDARRTTDKQHVEVRVVNEVVVTTGVEVRLIVPMNALEDDGDYFFHLTHTRKTEQWSERIKPKKYVEPDTENKG